MEERVKIGGSGEGREGNNERGKKECFCSFRYFLNLGRGCLSIIIGLKD